MIFVTVGTHEQQFNRLIQEMDRLIESGIIKEEVFIQRGVKSIVPRNCLSAEMLSYQDMVEKITDARIVITHGGPGSIMLCLSNMKIPIVVPRQSKYKEHVDDHQVDFTRRLEVMRKIIAIYEIEELEGRILNYDKLASALDVKADSQAELDRLVENLNRYCKTAP